MGLAASLALHANAAPGMGCERWTRLNDTQKQEVVQQMIAEALAGNRGRQYEINRDALGRCLRENAARMQRAFDDVCADSRRAGMQAIGDTFKTFAWSCAG